MNCIAIIPARGGSKRIPRKNIKPFHGKPIIAYSIEAALQSGLFTEVMVSTDDEEIAAIAKEHGATVPFYRSSETANDFAHLGQVVEEVLTEYAKRRIEFDYFCCLLPTAPFITHTRISQAFDVLTQQHFFSVYPVVQYSYPIQRALYVRHNKVSMCNPEHILTRSQDLEYTYHDSGQFYWCNTKEFLRTKVFLNDNTGAIILSPMEVQDIDSEEDWAIAEFKYSVFRG
ncbi:MAG: CMP-N,N'-diacetyllegionaminic acid synthase [Bacteroidetes bacterium ADurb.Bin217]|nr:MAG: CMP-N,N'-diacetyllegionaminic acid synthase [Bacteroidetes bacterium ADurb.Bin217]